MEGEGVERAGRMGGARGRVQAGSEGVGAGEEYGRGGGRGPDAR